jgi:hypothetical protein
MQFLEMAGRFKRDERIQIFEIFHSMGCDARKIWREKLNFSILFLTIQRMKAYQAVGVNFLSMSASGELEPGPRGVKLVAEVAAQAEGVREASHESIISVRTDAWGGFIAG